MELVLTAQVYIPSFHLSPQIVSAFQSFLSYVYLSGFLLSFSFMSRRTHLIFSPHLFNDYTMNNF